MSVARFEQSPPLPEPEALTSIGGEILAVRYDVGALLDDELGSDWQQRFIQIMNQEAVDTVRGTGHESVRESDAAAHFRMRGLDGHRTLAYFPGLGYLYQSVFLDLMRESQPESAADFKAFNDPYLAMNTIEQIIADEAAPATADKTPAAVQHRMEAHVDQRYTGILVIAAPEAGKGGRLVVANNSRAESVEEIDRDCTRIAHLSGTLVCFPRGRQLPHYTEPLRPGAGRRIIISMDYPAVTETEDQAWKLERYVNGAGTR